MKTKFKRSLSLLLSMLILAGCMMSFSVSAEDESSITEQSSNSEKQSEESFKDSGSMNLDVVFVLDASGSMLTSDPNKTALDAFNLFVDMCDETCNVGYDVYTHKIKDSEKLTNIKDKENLDKMKEKIEKIVYDPKGDTDIALGLTEAMKIFDEDENEDQYRRKAIVLLSDGNTDLPKGPRTVKESHEELEKTLSSLSDKSIPVYSIGLNYDKSLDKEELKNISSKTEGKVYETSKSDELIGIISDIFSNISDMNGIDLEITDGNVSFEIKDSSVFYVNVIIRSKLSVSELNPELKDPQGNKVDLKDNEDIKVTSTKSYTLIKIMYPKEGKWDLHLEKATSKNCSVKQLNFYSVFVKQNIPEDVTIGKIVQIEASINDGKGIVNDKDLLNDIEMTTVVETDNGTTEIKLKKGTNGVFTGEYPTEARGVLRITTKAVSQRFNKESSAVFVKVTEMADGNHVTSEEIEQQEQMKDNIIKIVIGVVIGIVVIVIVVIIITAAKQSKEKKLLGSVQHIEEAPRPKPQKAAPVPKYTAPPPEQERVNVTLVEHDTLENLINKGTDDAFSSKNADQFETDMDLEKLIRKGTDDAFSTQNADQYKTDAALEKLVRKGTDDAFSSDNADQYKTDEALEKLVRKGTDDAFSAANADQYKTDEALEKLVRKGSDDPFRAQTQNFEIDQSLASLIKTGGDGVGVGKEEETYDDDDYNSEE